MKKILNVLILTLAMNFLALLAVGGWLWKSGHLDKARVGQIKAVVFPGPATQPSPADQLVASPDATTQPSLQLERLLAAQAGHTASEQVEFIRRSFDAQMLQLDRRERELSDLQRQVDLANSKLAQDRTALEKQKNDLAAQQAESVKLQSDQGFQDSLALYQSLPSKQVKTIFLTLNEQTVEQYLDAMPARSAAKIIKEFKTADELAFVHRVMERMRSPSASALEK